MLKLLPSIILLLTSCFCATALAQPQLLDDFDTLSGWNDIHSHGGITPCDELGYIPELALTSRSMNRTSNSLTGRTTR